MKQETLEEVAERLYPENIESIMDGYHDSNSYQRESFIKGYKLAQERMYSEEEVLSLMYKAFKTGYTKYEVVEAGLEGLETEIECNWILKKFGKNN